MKKKPELFQKLNEILRKLRVNSWLHKYGSRKFRLRDHVFALAIREKCGFSFRETTKFLEGFGISCPKKSALHDRLGKVPLCLWMRILNETVNIESCSFAAIDATGQSRTKASSYFVKRIDRDTPLNRHIKLSLLVDTKTKIILALRIRAKPCHDVLDVKYLIKNSQTKIEVCLLDKGYDAEWIHRYLRENGIYSIIPARKNCRRGHYRKQMRDCLDYGLYWQRNHVEGVISSLKRKFGSYLSSCSARNQRAQMYLRAILHNLDIILASFRTEPFPGKDLNSVRGAFKQKG